MSHIVIIGAGIAGASAAFELRHKLTDAHRITLVNPVPHFSFVPSNPWVAVGWRAPADVTAMLAQGLQKNDIVLVLDTVTAHRSCRRIASSWRKAARSTTTIWSSRPGPSSPSTRSRASARSRATRTRSARSTTPRKPGRTIRNS